MSDSKANTVDSNGSDKIRIFLAIILVAAGIVGYYFFPDLNFYARLGIFVGGLVLAALVFFTCPTGKNTISFVTAAFNELKRVVWPTRKETIQMTGVVFVFAGVMALLLWIIDKLLAWIIYGGILNWS